MKKLIIRNFQNHIDSNNDNTNINDNNNIDNDTDVISIFLNS